MMDSKRQSVDALAVKYICSIKRLEYRTYEIELASKDGDRLISIARVERAAFDKEAESVTFDSEDVGKQVMLGLIYIRSVCSAVVALHRAQPESMEAASPMG
jgi:hypothetical protein